MDSFSSKCNLDSFASMYLGLNGKYRLLICLTRCSVILPSPSRRDSSDLQVMYILLFFKEYEDMI